MTTWCRTSLTTCAVLLLVASAHADVIRVPADHPTINQALAAASDGDLILLSAGDYPELVVIDDLDVDLVAKGFPCRVRSITVKDLAAGKTVLLQNLEVGPLGAAPNDDRDAITCLQSAGSVRIEECTAQGDAGSPGSHVPFTFPLEGASGVRVESCQDVVIVHGTLTGGHGGTLFDEDFDVNATDGGPAVNIRDSRVALHGLSAAGGNGGSVDDTQTDSGGDGGAGVLNVSGQVHVEDCQLTGGSGGFADCDFFIGVCGQGGYGGDGIRQTQPVASLSVRHNLYAPGTGGPGGDGVLAPDGKNVAVLAGAVQKFAAPPRQLQFNTPTPEGLLETVQVSGQAGDLVILHVGLAPGWTFKPVYQGVYELGAPLLVLPLGVVTGLPFELAAVVPDLGPGVEHVAFPVQLVIGDGTGFTLGPSKTLVLYEGP